MDELSLQDMDQLLKGTVVLHKNKLVKIVAIGRDKSLQLLDLHTLKKNTVPFVPKDISVPARRLGFVNINNNVVYAIRRPHRCYKIGIHPQNTDVKPIDRQSYSEDWGYLCDKVIKMECRELADCLFNEYPSFTEALSNVRNFGGACAFDKQFAIDHLMRLFYRLQHVGNLPKGGRYLNQVKWIDGKEYCKNLIGANYAEGSGLLQAA